MPHPEERTFYLLGHRLHGVHQHRLVFRLFNQIQSPSALFFFIYIHHWLLLYYRRRYITLGLERTLVERNTRQVLEETRLLYPEILRTNSRLRLQHRAPFLLLGMPRMLRSAQHRETHHGQENCQALLFKQPQKTIMKVRRSTINILNMKTRKATTNIRSVMTRRRPKHITTKHCETKCAPMFDCSSTTCSAKNATTTSKSAKNVTTTLSVKDATTTSN